MKNKVAIIGAGFSGLSLAWALSKRGIEVEIFEAANRPGGMISSQYDKILFESAANAILSSANVEILFSDINIKPIKAGFKSNKRWIFRNKMKNVPLNLSEILNGLSRLVKAWFKNEHTPFKNETVQSWSIRVLNQSFNDYLFSPALQGIYGLDSSMLSAKLIIGGFFNSALKPKKAKFHGSLSAPDGMEQIVSGLVTYLDQKKIKIHYQNKIEFQTLNQDFAARVVATSFISAAELLTSEASRAAKLIKNIPYVNLSSFVMGFQDHRQIKGFGCLFPKNQKFSSLGVLFNSDIFAHRGDLESETWIFNHTDKTELELKNLVLEDRLRLGEVYSEPVICRLKKWPQALPLYGEELVSFLTSDVLFDATNDDPHNIQLKGARLTESKNPIYLTGNYLGGIGLAKILDYNIRLAERIEKEII